MMKNSDRALRPSFTCLSMRDRQTRKRRRPRCSTAGVVFMAALTTLCLPGVLLRVSLRAACDDGNSNGVPARRRLVNVDEGAIDRKETKGLIQRVLGEREVAVEENHEVDAPPQTKNEYIETDPLVHTDFEKYLRQGGNQPTDSPAPSPSPSQHPTYSPSYSLFPSPAPTNHPTDTDAPSPSPSETPTMMVLTPRPTIAPTPQPTIATPIPTPSPTPIPTSLPTISPVATTPRPSRMPTNSPTPMATESPTPLPSGSPSPLPSGSPSSVPSGSPSVVSSRMPSYLPSGAPSIAPTMQLPSVQSIPTKTPTSFVPVRTTPLATLSPTNAVSVDDDESGKPSLDEVPFDPFDVTLNFGKGLDQLEVNQLALELGLAVSDFMKQGLANVDLGNGVVLQEFYLIITAPISETTQRLRRRLQQETSLKYGISGSADFDMTDESAEVDTLDLKRRLSSSIDSLFEKNHTDFVSFIKARDDTDILKTVDTASVQLEEPTPSKPDKPSVVEIVFGFLLVALMAAGLAFYIHLWLKGRRKRRAERKRGRQGIVASIGPGAFVKPSTLKQEAAVAQSGYLGRIPTQATRTGEESSSEDSAYGGIPSGESVGSSSGSAFSKELKLAAALDKRAWTEYQQQRKMIAEEGRSIGGTSPNRTPYQLGKELALYEGYTEGMEIVQDEDTDVVIKPTSPARSPSRGEIRTSSFPYGDEDKKTTPSSPDPPAFRSSDLLPDINSSSESKRGSILQYRPESRNSEPYVSGVSPLSISKTLTQSPKRDSPLQRRRERNLRYQGDEAGSPRGDDPDTTAIDLMNTLTADTSDAARKARHRSPNSLSPSRQGADALEAAMAVRALESVGGSLTTASNSGPTSQSQSTQSLHDNGTESDTEDTNRARFSPLTALQTNSVSNVTPSPKLTDDDDTFEKSKSSSLMSLDVVAEVAKLAKFVQRYELKKERRAEKQRAKKETASAMNESRSLPSVGYDAFSDSENHLPSHSGNASPSFLPHSYSSRTDSDSDDFSISDTDSVSTTSRSRDLSVEKARAKTPDGSMTKSDRTEKRRNMYIEHTLSDSSEDDFVVEDDVGSDSSRLGITPFSMEEQLDESYEKNPFTQPNQQKIHAMATGTAPKPKSKPPPTRRLGATVLSPIPGTPASLDTEFSSMKRSSPTEELESPVGDESRSPPLKKFKSPRASTTVGPSPSSARKRGLGEESRNGAKKPSGRKKTLASLRMREAILDESNSEIGSSAALALSIGEDGSKNTTGDSAAPSDELSPRKMDGQPKPSSESFQTRGRQLRNPQTATAPRRSHSNEGFTKVINMFEGKTTEPIFPKNESWQYMN